MMIRMAVADANQDYVTRLANVLEDYEDLNLSVFTERYSLETALASRRFDVLLFDSDLYDGQVGLPSGTLPIMLWNSEKPVPESCKSFAKVAKYQRISNIYRQVLELYADVCGNVDSVLGTKGVRICAFYSPVGGCGKTTTALVAAKKLALQGLRTFYISLEEMASESCYLPQNAEKGLSEIAAALGGDVNFNLKLQGLLQTKSDRFFYLNHFDSPNDILEITEQELEELFSHLRGCGLFDYIIVDMGVSMNANQLRIFELADKLVIVGRPDEMASGKLNTFFKQIHIMNEYQSKMLFLMNFDNGRVTESAYPVPLIGKIAFAPNQDSAGLIDMLAGYSGTRFTDALTE